MSKSNLSIVSTDSFFSLALYVYILSPSLSPCFNLNFKTRFPPSLNFWSLMNVSLWSVFFCPNLILKSSLLSPRLITTSEFISGSLPSVVYKIESYPLYPVILFKHILNPKSSWGIMFSKKYFVKFSGCWSESVFAFFPLRYILSSNPFPDSKLEGSIFKTKLYFLFFCLYCVSDTSSDFTFNSILSPNLFKLIFPTEYWYFPFQGSLEDVYSIFLSRFTVSSSLPPITLLYV